MLIKKVNKLQDANLKLQDQVEALESKRDQDCKLILAQLKENSKLKQAAKVHKSAMVEELKNSNNIISVLRTTMNVKL